MLETPSAEFGTSSGAKRGLAILAGLEGREKSSKQKAWRAALTLLEAHTSDALKDKVLDILRMWKKLPQAMRAGILAMIRASS